ncbi:MAG TPA: CsiV family protein [Candidatus Acidoferrum sp.]|nr:CsiV family protein [Candidatus Acidoferrum sp.]
MANARFIALLLTAAMALTGGVVCAQPTSQPARDPRGPSADGNYWFEVEVTIFSSVYGSGGNREVPVPSSTLRYLNPLRQLQLQSDSYRFPFDTDEGKAWLAGPAPVATVEGPELSPADPRAFKMLDQERDPFLALDKRAWRFNQLNSRLQGTGEHTVLWHQVWRQPLRPRAQTPALQVEGGDAYGDHYQLEGSVRISGQGELPVIDANLWLGSFSHERGDNATDWKLPQRPRGDDEKTETAAPAQPWYPHDVWQLNQTRDLGPNALYYLDHPALGLLIELRPYLVPEAKVPTTETPRPARKTGFE